jgi:hypothetical protein
MISFETVDLYLPQLNDVSSEAFRTVKSALGKHVYFVSLLMYKNLSNS